MMKELILSVVCGLFLIVPGCRKEEPKSSEHHSLSDFSEKSQANTGPLSDPGIPTEHQRNEAQRIREQTNGPQGMAMKNLRNAGQGGRIGVRATHLTRIENEGTCEMCSPDTYLLSLLYYLVC